MKYQRATPDHVPALTALWNRVFGDSMAEIEAMFAALEGCWTPFAALDEDTQIVGMAYAVPVTVCWDEDSWPAAYLYAVAVAPEQQNRGVGSGLMRHVEGYLRRQNKTALLLEPSGPDARRLYERLGFADNCPVQPARRAETPSPVGHAEPCSVLEYASLRETLLWDTLHVRYPKAWLECEAQAATLYRLRLGNALGCAAAWQGADGLCLDEILPGPEMTAALRTLPLHQPGGAARLGSGWPLMVKALRPGFPREPIYGPLTMNQPHDA